LKGGKKVASPHLRAVFTEPYTNGAPKKFMGRDIPELFTASFYIVDNDGIKVTKENGKRFKTIRYDLMLRVTEIGTIDVVRMEIEGAKPYQGHIIVTSKAYEPKEVGSVLPRHFSIFQTYRARFISIATLSILQTSQYKKTKGGGHSWTIGDKIEIPIADLEAINAFLTKPTYKKLDGTFYQEFAKLYRDLVSKGDRTPIKTLRDLYYPEKTTKHIQSYATTCRKRGLLPPAEQGRNSEVRKPRKKKGR
jgi:hypothetical protein